MAAPFPRAVSRSHRDLVLIMMAFAYGVLLALRPTAAGIALGLWWNANTISHNFIHRPFFRSRSMNAAFSFYLTLVLGFPQSLWRKRHLAHHGVRDPNKLRVEPLDVAGAVLLWSLLPMFATEFTLVAYLPGFVVGLGLCFLQGHFEHARGTTSHYGSLYNLLLLNDGYHVEHHAHPGVHWSELPGFRIAGAKQSRWPALLRWLECLDLCALERLVLDLPVLQRFVIDRHERALRRLSIDSSTVRSVGIVGGGLFPRSAIVLRRVIPEAKLAIIDMSPENIDTARRFIGGAVEFIEQRFEAREAGRYDMVVIPLAFIGSREQVYREPPAKFVLVHDWVWNRRGKSAVVSWLLLKRLNLVTR